MNFTKLNPEAHIPTQGSPHAAGWDLRALEKTVIHKGKSTKILTGLALAIPHGWEGQIRSRSSLGAKGLIMPNGVGTIDSDYRGEIMVLSTWIGVGDSFTVGAALTDVAIVGVGTTVNEITIGTAHTSPLEIVPGTGVREILQGLGIFPAII